MFIKAILKNGIEHRTECMHYSSMDHKEDPMQFYFFAEVDLRNRQIAREIMVDKSVTIVYIENYLGKTIDIYKWDKKGIRS